MPAGDLGPLDAGRADVEVGRVEQATHAAATGSLGSVGAAVGGAVGRAVLRARLASGRELSAAPATEAATHPAGAIAARAGTGRDDRASVRGAHRLDAVCRGADERGDEGARDDGRDEAPVQLRDPYYTSREQA